MALFSYLLIDWFVCLYVNIAYHTFSHLIVIPLDLLYMFYVLPILHQFCFLSWFSTSHPTASEEEGFLLGSTHISLLVDTSSSYPVSGEPPPRYLSSLQKSHLSLVLLLWENLFWDYTHKYTHSLFLSLFLCLCLCRFISGFSNQLGHF